MPDADYPLSVTELVKQSYENASGKGFWDNERTDETIPSKIALIHSEASEALESYRDPMSDLVVKVPVGLFEDLIKGCRSSVRDDAHTVADQSQALLDAWNAKPRGLDVELADIVIRVGDLAGALGIDLQASIQKKHAFNLGRIRKHGRIA